MIVKVKNLVKRYGEKIALDHFNMEVEEGEIEVFGRKITSNSYDIKRQIGLVPQEVSVFENLTVRENIDYFCGLYIDDKKTRRKLVDEAIEFVELKGYEKFYPKKLSGGLKRRLNIACGISHKPKLIFLDEPTVAVDVQSRNFILEGIKKLNQEGSTIIYTTHYLEEAERLCTRVVIMDNGKDIASGTTEELKAMITTSEKIVVSFIDIEDDTAQKLMAIPHVIDVDRKGNDFVIKFENATNNLANLMNFITENKLVYTKLYSHQPTLNDVFLELTGKELRD